MSYSHIASPRHDQEFQHPYRIFMEEIIDGQKESKRCRTGEILATTCLNRIDFSIFPVIELDDGNIFSPESPIFDGKNPWFRVKIFP
jgi:hypothetical protein